MSGARDIILNGLAQSDLDGGGHKLVNWDTSNLIFGQFGAQLANRIYAGPASGSAAIPAFRIVTADEVGAQPHSTNLDILAVVTPTQPGLQFLALTIPVTSGYTKVQKVGSGTIVSVLTSSQLRTDIDAQPLADALTALAATTPTFTGLNMVQVPDPLAAGYPKHNGADAGQPWTFLTPAQLLADIGGSSGGAGGAGKGDDLAYSMAAEITLAPSSAYIQWFQRVSLDVGGADNYWVSITLSAAHAAKGAVFTVRLEFAAGCIATVNIYDAFDVPVIIPLLTISGNAELPAQTFEAKFVFNGTSWGNPSGYYVNL